MLPTMNASKPYTLSILTKADEPEIDAVLAKNPLWKRKHARDLVARRKFIAKLQPMK